ncbi:MAG: glycosyltransferase [Anaerolineales bacterium]|nr:glycosyltransferase [Anaerolineales bacterium]
MPKEAEPRPQKILFLIPTLASGGTERQAAELVRRLDRERFEPLVAVMYGLDRVPAEISVGGARLLSLRKPLGKLGNLVALFRLWRLILCERPAVVQSFLRHADLYARIAGGLALQRRIVTSLRTRIGGFWSKPWQWTERILWRLSARIVSNSVAAAREAESLLGIPASRLAVIPNGVDLERFHPGLDWRAPRAAFGLSPSDLVFGMVARYSPVKDHATLLTAVAQMRNSGYWPEYARLFLVGGTTFADSRRGVEDRIRELGLESVVLPMGVLADVERAYAALDWLILPSRFEGFPNSVLEAMACGKPAIVSDAANAEGIVAEGETGWEFPAGDALALAACLRRAIGTPPEQRVAMGRAARTFVEGRYSTRLMVRKFESLYEELAERR